MTLGVAGPSLVGIGVGELVGVGIGVGELDWAGTGGRRAIGAAVAESVGATGAAGICVGVADVSGAAVVGGAVVWGAVVGGGGILTATASAPFVLGAVMHVVPAEPIRSHTSKTLLAGALAGTVTETVKDGMSGTAWAGAAAKTPFHPKIAVWPACNPAIVTGMT